MIRVIKFLWVNYADEMTKYDPNVALAMGGEGTRFGNIARKENKPAAKLPTNGNYRIMASTLNLEAAAGLLGNKENDVITYISQKDEIKGDNVYLAGKYKTDGGAIAEGLARGIIRNDKDIVILNGDIFTNADITRAYHALKTLPNAALVIPYYPVDEQRAKSFGLLGIEEDSNNNMQIISFIEKPKYTSMPTPDELVPGEYKDALKEFKNVQLAHHPSQDGIYLANLGMYFLSNEASKVLMAQGIINPNETGLGKHAMPKIVELANQCKLKDKDGNELKVYTVPLEAKGGKPAVWEDIGTAEAYLRIIKDVAWQTKLYGTTPDNKYYGMPEFVLNDFKKNTDLETGIVYGSNNSHWDFELFKERYHVSSARGNIFLTVD